MSFPKYPAYKNSGVEWIGEIPVGWIISPLRYLAHCLDGKRIPLNKEERSYKKGDIPYWGANCIVDFVDEFLFNQELILLGEDGAPFFDKTKEVSFYINEPIWPNNHVHVLKVFENFSPKFLVYSLNCVEYSSYIEGSTRDKLTQNNMNRIVVPIPPLPEQQAIASFLDRECGKIDALIAEQERLIALLAEKRQAVISHAVTKGLNPNAPMKESGIPWIGMVPEGWDCSRLRFVAQFNPSKTEISYIPLNEEVSFLPMEAIRDDGTINLEQKRKISDVQNGYTYFRDMDIVFAKITPCFENGKGAVVKKLLRGIGFGTTELIVARSVPSRVIPEYLFRFFQSDIFRKPAEASMYGAGGQKRVSERFVRDFSVYLPPLPDQQAIASFLDLTCSKIDTLIAEQKTMLTLCKERRAALISAAVTGKIDVRAQNKALAA
ncbi:MULTISPECIES: restriction endonuclease subunit S [Acetobacter]|uniref:Type-1 restriction enzyme StySJI specificity protein n=1 Tax=Acetobacter pomorum DM001 TaxID=945681 RepID=F1YV45_9PROT|nr:MULTISPECIES: restriction endonuclease subunit S [Acetobacter]ATI11988.1 restriction endonuclease subunit S [Acetobacter pomorum]AXC25643.1 restriction endonuclease subunit S [Acetobacter sp. JWB]EGE47150.1 Type-1 restriction enzyme StySJI specificity protein [Acetobacter pomorum DM001]KAA8419262.1 restriction endonuclease subunit S [Acetobacter pomorum]KAA8434376.1 restriction endonuclease subunit S [Acetobacter pomorum]